VTVTHPPPPFRWLRVGVVAALWTVLTVSTAATQAGRNLIGYCVGLRGLETAKAAGFDYVELGTTEIANLSDADFEAAAAHVKAVGIPTPNANLFLPGSIHLTGPARTPTDVQMAYVQKAFTRLERLGVTILCFGSGGARRVPEGFAKDEAFQQLVAFGKRIAPEARAHGITIVIEPLRRQESNIINSAAEGLDLVNAVDDPNFQLLIDFYHLASEQEDPDIILRAGSHLRHLHMANPTGRVFPLEWGEYDYTKFFANLRQVGYAGRMSVEASSRDVAAEGPRAIALLRRAFAGPMSAVAPGERPSTLAARRAAAALAPPEE
jgi:sugar phosphate isomerase/epimerase